MYFEFKFAFLNTSESAESFFCSSSAASGVTKLISSERPVISVIATLSPNIYFLLRTFIPIVPEGTTKVTRPFSTLIISRGLSHESNDMLVMSRSCLIRSSTRGQFSLSISNSSIFFLQFAIRPFNYSLKCPDLQFING